MPVTVCAAGFRPGSPEPPGRAWRGLDDGGIQLVEEVALGFFIFDAEGEM